MDISIFFLPVGHAASAGIFFSAKSVTFVKNDDENVIEICYIIALWNIL